MIVSHELNFELMEPDGRTPPGISTFTYDPADPFAVAASFPGDGRPSVWTFGRELLASGITSRDMVGDGEVRIGKCGYSKVHIELTGPDGQCHLHFRSVDIEDFLDVAYSEVPRGKEGRRIDWDGFLRRLTKTCHHCRRDTCACRT